MLALRLATSILFFSWCLPVYSQASEEIELSRCFQEAALSQDGLMVKYAGFSQYWGRYNYRYFVKAKTLVLRYDATGAIVLKEEVVRLKEMSELFETTNTEFCLGDTQGTSGEACKPQLANFLFPRIRVSIAAREKFRCE